MAETGQGKTGGAGSTSVSDLGSGAAARRPSEDASLGAPAATLPDEAFDPETEMEQWEARRGRQRIGEPIEGVEIGTPAGAGSEALHRAEEIPVHENHRGQSKERTGLNRGPSS